MIFDENIILIYYLSSDGCIFSLESISYRTTLSFNFIKLLAVQIQFLVHSMYTNIFNSMYGTFVLCGSLLMKSRNKLLPAPAMAYCAFFPLSDKHGNISHVTV